MNPLHENIDQQFGFNQGKNLFYQGILDCLRFSPETMAAIEKMDTLDTDSENLLIDELTRKAIQEFCRINQYYTFDKEDRQALRNLYTELVANLKNRTSAADVIAEQHYQKLITWLKQTNPFAEQIYSPKGEMIEAVACSEYSPDLQIEILDLDIKLVASPALDIGCGKQGRLVMFLREKGLEAFGFDRFAGENPYLSNADWFEFHFERGRWGTIISHLGFSNHFYHHHVRNDGNFAEYARKYMEILESLKPGGSFHYAPALPFVEQYLDSEKFRLTTRNIGSYEFKASKITRLRF